MKVTIKAVANIAHVYDGKGIVTIANVGTDKIKTREFARMIVDNDTLDMQTCKVLDVINETVNIPTFDIDNTDITLNEVLTNAVKAMTMDSVDFYID